MTLLNSSRAEELLLNHLQKVREKKRNLSPKKKIWVSQKRSQKKPPHPTARRRKTSCRQTSRNSFIELIIPVRFINNFYEFRVLVNPVTRSQQHSQIHDVCTFLVRRF